MAFKQKSRFMFYYFRGHIIKIHSFRVAAAAVIALSDGFHP